MLKKILGFTEHKAHILPPCTVKIKDCHFCAAVTWPEKIKDESGNMTWKLGINYCLRLNCSDKDCFRIVPNLNLPSEKWSIVEFTKALGLISYETQRELEFFMRIGGEFNRIYDLQKNLKCRVCGKYMSSIKKNARWKKVFNLRDLTWKNHFAIFNATTFSCQNENCSEHGKAVYMSYCWHCGAGYSLKCRGCSKIFVPKTTLLTEKGRNFHCTKEKYIQTLKILSENLKRDAERLNLKPILWNERDDSIINALAEDLC